MLGNSQKPGTGWFVDAQGVHITFVRSVTMDKWSEVQAKRMTLGGNENALIFFKSHPDYRDGMTIPEKYQSEFAAFYKEKLTALCDGLEWTMPPIGSRRSVTQPTPTPSTAAAPVGSLSNGTPSLSYIPTKAQNEDYFAKKGMENLSRPEHLPPNQGGKYAGFGSSCMLTDLIVDEPPEPDSTFDDPLASFSKGWSVFSSFAVQGAKLAVSGAETLGKTVTESVIKPTAAAVRDPDFQQNLSTYVGTIGQKVTEYGSKGIQLASEAASKGIDMASTVTSNTLASANNYSPVSGNNWEGSYGSDWSQQKPASQTKGWDDWTEPDTPEHWHQLPEQAPAVSASAPQDSNGDALRSSDGGPKPKPSETLPHEEWDAWGSADSPAPKVVSGANPVDEWEDF
ncbi:hypothetical protein HDU91_004549 [Kappamyces sp. JEL0680]|nr:hypothetical protein HDU91_004549 [Kappamyces sp. JEL0680]